MNSKILKKNWLVGCLLFSLYLCACNSEPNIDIPGDIASLEHVSIYDGNEPPVYEIYYEREVQFGDTEELFIGSVSGVDVDMNGRVYLADRNRAKVHVYDPDGSYQFSFGGSGEGPGEFTGVSQPILYKDRIYVLDVMQQRISEFDPADGRFIRSINLGDGQVNMGGFPISFHPISEDRFLVFFNHMEPGDGKYYRNVDLKLLDSQGEVLSENFLEFKQGEMFMIQTETMIQIMSLPFMRQSFAAIDQNENIVWGHSERLFFQRADLSGDTLSSFYHAKPNPELDIDALLSQYEDRTVRQSIRELEIPDTKPAYKGFRIDDENRIWLQLLSDDDDELEWWILSEQGEKLAQFGRSSNDQLEKVKNEKAYFFEEDEDGSIRVVRYSIHLQ